MWHRIHRCIATDTVENAVIDDIDRQIIRILQQDGRLAHREIGDRVGLSPNATGVRVKRLLDDGIISGVHARVNHAALGRGVEAFIDCWLEERGPEQWERFRAHVEGDERILDAVHLTGKVDYRLRVVVASPSELDDLLDSLRRRGGIGETDTRLILRRFPVGGAPAARSG